MISDSVWCIVHFFNSNNKLKQQYNKEAKHLSIKRENQFTKVKSELIFILKRISENYFKFFIRLCDDSSNSRKDRKDLKDNILEIFYDFLSQCVFYSIYLAFPKSRHFFDRSFMNKIVSTFAYLYNGLNMENFSLDHWDLDLGTGNMIDFSNENNIYKKSEKENNKADFLLPDISDLQTVVLIPDYNNMDKKPKDNIILNTPLYRFYSKNNNFETLNMIKPIKLKKKG